MEISVVEEPANRPEALERYSSVPIAFTVTSRFAVRPLQNGLGGLLFIEEPVLFPYIKDYDALKGEGPTRWASHFDLSHWGLLFAVAEETVLGGAAVAWNTPNVDLLEDRNDLAVLWDLRVRPEYRGRGVGRRLFAAAEEWAQTRGCRTLKVETQNINVSACRFYARQGCVLKTICHNAYPSLPDEVQLLWYKSLAEEAVK